MPDATVEETWTWLLAHLDDEAYPTLLRDVAVRASRHPTLRPLRPYLSLNSLKFTDRAEYPFEQLPYVVVTPLDSIEARDWNHAILRVGDASTIVEEVARALAARRHASP